MNKKWIILIGVFSILACITTWTLDLTNLVEQCIYCRTERTIIGLLGLLMLFPIIKFLNTYLALVLGFFGSNVAADQVFMNIRHHHFGSFFLLASAALFFIIFQIGIIHFYSISTQRNRIGQNENKK